jgi:hypothetical protein
MTATFGFEEGDTCGRDGCAGTIRMRASENCSCHISPPCNSCTAARQHCDTCDWDEADEPETFVMNDYVVTADRKTGNYLSWEPRPLDPAKIDYYSKSHSSCSMVKEGVYPQSGDESADREMVRKEVDGTFGGRFESFGAGRFKFIAYTD